MRLVRIFSLRARNFVSMLPAPGILPAPREVLRKISTEKLGKPQPFMQDLQ